MANGVSRGADFERQVEGPLRTFTCGHCRYEWSTRQGPSHEWSHHRTICPILNQATVDKAEAASSASLKKFIEEMKERERIRLDMSNRHLTSFCPIGHFEDYKILNLRWNKLERLPKSLGNWKALETIYLSDNKLVELPEEIGELEALQELHLNKNQLTKLPEGMRRLKNLKGLYMTYNNLERLPDWIGEWEALEELGLSHNKLTKLPEGVGKLTRLRELYLTANRLETVPATVGQLQALTTLNLRDNPLTSLPSSINNLKQLRFLQTDRKLLVEEAAEWNALRKRNQGWHIPPSDFEELVTFLRKHSCQKIREAIDTGLLLEKSELTLSKGLTDLPNSLAYLTNLKKLTLANNKLCTLPIALVKLSKLEELNLSNNELVILPLAIRGMTALKQLYANDNFLEAIPDWIGELTALEVLCLPGNSLVALPVGMKELKNLKELYLSHNRIKEFRWIEELVTLRTLDLSMNQLTLFPMEIGKLTALQILELDRNQLTLLPEIIGNLINLQKLLLFQNRLKHLPDRVSELTQLRQLSLSDNLLEIIPTWIGRLSNLEELGLGWNCLAILPPPVGTLTSLRELNLSTNQLTLLPDLRGLTNLNTLHLSNNQLTVLSNSIGYLSQLKDLNLGDNPKLTILPISLSNCTQITCINTVGSGIPDESRMLMMRTIQRIQKGAPKLSEKLMVWRGIGQVEVHWPELTDEGQKSLLYEWLLRLESTSDFQNCQAELANITCQILTTVFNDAIFREQFFNLIAADLERCGDRAAMSLNLVYTEWCLHLLPKNAELGVIAALLIGYAKTHKLREIILRDHGDKEESVERFLYAESRLRDLGLVTAVKTMLHLECGATVNLQTVAEEIRAIADAEHIYELTWWQNYLNKHYPKRVERQREIVAAELELILQNEELTDGDKNAIAIRFRNEQPKRVYLPITEELLSQI